MITYIFVKQLQLKKMETELLKKTEELNRLKAKLEDEHVERVKQSEEEWLKRVDDLKVVVTEKLKGINCLPFDLV